jgi:hypothetical protein
MSGLQGNLKGVGADIVGFLTDVATHFNLTIVVTSGYRDAAAQAAAMLGNWKKLKRGMVYAKATLPEEDRKQLDRYYIDALENPNASEVDRKAARAAFLALAADKVGSKGKHTMGRAVDVAQASVPIHAYRVITRRMKEVKEGRNDIYHFESVPVIPKATPAEMKAWGRPTQGAISRSSPAQHAILARGHCGCIG